MAITINQITPGIGLLINNDVYLVTNYSHVKPGKGSAFARVKLKHVKNGSVIEKTFRPADRLEEVALEEKKVQYLYRAGDSFHFMDQTTFEEVVISQKILGDEVIKFLQDNLDVTAVCHKNQVLKVILPTFILATITETEPGFRGDTSRAGTKPAKIETGANLLVPLFVNQGDQVRIDTRTGQYVERVQK